MISVTTGPSSKLVAELSVIKTELGISDSSQDSRLNRLIRAVSSAFAGTNGLQREPWRQTYEEQLPGRGGIYLRLSRWPIESVSGLDEGDTTLETTDYSIADPERSKLYREDGWIKTAPNLPIGAAGTGDEDLDYTVDFIAGWLMPGDVDDWEASTAYASGDWVRSSSDAALFLFKCTSAGTSGGSEPTWPTEAAGEVVDSGATWTAFAARELPDDLEEAAIIQVMDWYRGGLQIPSGIKSERLGPQEVEYLPGAASQQLSPAVEAILRSYR